MENPVQWTVEQLRGALARIQRDAERKRVEISTLNGKLITLEQRAKTIADPQKRATALAAIKALVQRQVKIVAAWRTFSKRTAELAQRARVFLGGAAQLSGTEMGEIGAVFIPPALAALAIVALVAVVWLSKAILAQQHAVKVHEQLLNAWLSGQLTDAQYHEASQQIDHEAQAMEPPGDPFGITKIAEALIPLALIVAAIVVLPPVLEGIHGRRLAGGRA